MNPRNPAKIFVHGGMSMKMDRICSSPIVVVVVVSIPEEEELEEPGDESIVLLLLLLGCGCFYSRIPI